MKIALADIAASLDSGREMIAAVLQQTESPSKRASLLVKTLRSLWPSCSVYACVLSGEQESHVSVLDEAGNPRPEWAGKMQTELVELADARKAKRAHSLSQLDEPGLRGHTLVIEPITLLGRFQGALSLGLPRSTPNETLILARFWLAVCAEQLASRFQLEAHEREQQPLKEEVQELTCLANIGELARPVTHEFNNFLNSILLHVATLERDLPEKLRSELAEIHFQGTQVAGMVKQFQQYRRREAPVQQRTDLNQVVRHAVETVCGRVPIANEEIPLMINASRLRGQIADRTRRGESSLSLSLAPDLPPVLASASTLKRLCTLLLTNAAAAVGSDKGSIWVRTVSCNGRVQLRVEDTGPAIAPELLTQWFNPMTVCREGANGLELAACQTVVRRLRGKIQCENRAEGGVTMVVELPASA